MSRQKFSVAKMTDAMLEATRTRMYWERVGVTPEDLYREMGCEPTWDAVERVIRRLMMIALAK